ncbi:uncharacterized protein LOC115065952 isoform X2 [Bactrocera dorsalis]|uniref:Uncharacterized protein LOC115065952 isoform X2 n=1 Tax=Bactrocera dorsalis TaxID=27457 RepID=A0ABM3K2F4_BACDO|nr:uncharacterized protein LOC115065952 isoform X2 [Bactrocera dorsalis]XP_049315654.1 uncharacterized protein LOC115065952 isoform X2 [Bactrocera dorsalis]XP_049315655.1 uncharacterized protein LOC115065952 isoform X2 [Bactrocera dorsalis]XP_049315657.1 uncharacterized protein LOC115065952 isoform X2 [Bactrocera dorsalis]XP_049315658.1 uncharacterized protein LOC115065952 isoform X2 [Bactrocera dorsalis]XP_049315659.1 uncharacterized protein LOC115065952 isoform X2 [Bactrocera dorsalis]XP_04
MDLPKQFLMLKLNAENEMSSASATPNLSSTGNERFVLRSNEVKTTNCTDLNSENDGEMQDEPMGEMEKINKYVICGIDSPKRVGPLVPPKPYKKKQNYPEMSMRCVTDKVCKAHYSKQMDSTSNALHKSSPSATLDIPAVLDQQLAALTHHKRQLEKKAICLSQQNPREKLISDAINFAKSSLYTLETEDCISNIIYSKPHIFSSHVDSTAIDANVSESPSDTESVLNDLRQRNPSKYINQKKKDSVADVPQSHELSIDVIENTLECSNLQPEEILPPPSPVSSSYSELRKATTVFKKTFHPCYVKNHESKVNCNDSNIHDLCGPYMNVTCSNDFNSYCSTLQTDYNNSIDIYRNGSSSQAYKNGKDNSGAAATLNNVLQAAS